MTLKSTRNVIGNKLRIVRGTRKMNKSKFIANRKEKMRRKKGKRVE
ncbi:hypothetical protein [Saccharolobus islandicus]|uniref:Uncharacterized protein n=3 Tax=Saccharolobus islandicus TaxID=43080 RepID=C3MUE9_SACI4|nr:hypothetical protein [Sulfolobus islandicus]ACP37183.1 hypothetical protein, glimmer [Sulfolobus islandicus M.14.25]ACP54323.1 hypothetical protein M1627_2925 [Sulfolobus islandicus M.16.27]ADX81673.1 hypothetical protein, glimmer [Sulfolobus islandicus HVE10/4]WCM36952.1 hypothetical protein GO599_05450 [Sulfolobus islandicus]